MKSQVIGLDFDGTMVTHKYPAIGEPLDYAVETVLKLIDAGHKIVLITMRSDERLEQAVDYLNEEGITLWGINENPAQKHWTNSPKIFSNIFIGDECLGCPTNVEPDGRLVVDWIIAEEMLIHRGLIE